MMRDLFPVLGRSLLHAAAGNLNRLTLLNLAGRNAGRAFRRERKA